MSAIESKAEKAYLQREQYRFPYHYIPVVSESSVSRDRWLDWGWEYVAYQDLICRLAMEGAPQSILDVGCGDGYLLNSMGERPDVRLVGVDTDEHAITLAKIFARGAEFLATDASSLAEQFDVVTSVEVLEHVPDEGVDRFAQAVLRRVRSGGLLIVTVPSDDVPVTAKHHRHYNEEALSRTFEAAALAVGRTMRNPKVWKTFSPPVAYEFIRKLLANRLWRLSTPSTDRIMSRWTRRLCDSPSTSGWHVILTANVH